MPGTPLPCISLQTYECHPSVPASAPGSGMGAWLWITVAGVLAPQHFTLTYMPLIWHCNAEAKVMSREAGKTIIGRGVESQNHSFLLFSLTRAMDWAPGSANKQHLRHHPVLLFWRCHVKVYFTSQLPPCKSAVHCKNPAVVDFSGGKPVIPCSVLYPCAKKAETFGWSIS